MTASGAVVVGRYLGVVGEGIGLMELDRLHDTPLTASEVAGWWGASLVPNQPAMPAELLQFLSPEALVSIWEGAYALLPKLPVTTRHLWLSQVVEGRDLPELMRFPGLMSLRLNNYDQGDLGTAPSAVDLPALRSLTWHGPSANALPLIATWTNLREVTIAADSWQDLALIATMPALERFAADGCAQATVPNRIGPALIEVSMLGTAVDAASAQRFTAEHPQVRLTWTYGQALRRALDHVTGVVIRDIAHDPDHALAPYVGTATEAAMLAGMVDIDEHSSGSPCFCSGDTVISWQRGNSAPVELNYLHGIRLRWGHGPWPGDAGLTPGSGRAIAVWLRDHGFPYAWDEAEEARQDMERRMARAASVAALLPGAAATAAAVLCQNPAAILDMVPPDGPDGVRVRLLLSLVGPSEDPLDFRGHVREALLALPGDSIAAVLRQDLSPAAAAGAAWWLLDQGHLKDLPVGSTSPVIDATIVAMLAQTPPSVFAVTIAASRATPGAEPALRRLVLAHLAAAATSPALADPHALAVVNDRLLKSVSVPALAALGLARLGAVECLPDLEARIYSPDNVGNDSRAWYLAAAALRALITR